MHQKFRIFYFDGQVKMGINPRGKRVALKFIDIEMDKHNSKDKNARDELLTFIACEITNIQISNMIM